MHLLLSRGGSRFLEQQMPPLSVSISLKTLVTVSALTDAKYEEAVAPIKR